ncbi:NAD-dependent epimerase/dehydratase family protein [Nocardioides panacisoli]|uniref:NAD-dependent epimerase/dehydratase family protein n=1 Tax=Nocardioides panacisoli TaxID=627624 RepID=A0ABP7HZP8_9ACTN
MRVVVTGGTGNVGSRLVERLAADPEVDEVVAVSRREPDDVPAGVEWRAANLAEHVPRDLLPGVDAVVHLAWLFQPTRDPGATWRANVEGTVRLLSAAADAGVRTVVQASSVGVYSRGPGRRPVDESWPAHGIPTAAYSREKAYVERLLDVFEQHNPSTRVVRMRPAFIFRRESSVQQRRLFAGPLAPTRLISHLPLPVLPDPGVTLQVVHTDDVVEAYRLALLREVRGAFNIATGPTLDVPAIARLLGARAVPVPARLTRLGVGAAWAAHLLPASPGLFDLLAQIPVMRTDRAREELGWEPQRDAETTFGELWAGFRSGEGGPTPPLAPATSGRLRSHEFATGLGWRP